MHKASIKQNLVASLLFFISFSSLSCQNPDVRASGDNANDSTVTNDLEPCEETDQQAIQDALRSEDFSDLYPWLDVFHDEFSDALDGSALWLNDRFSDEQENLNHQDPKAWARVILGWEPKEGDLSKTPLKFRIKVRLPKLKHKVNLIFSDNESEDYGRLPLESSRPTDDSLRSRDFSAAIQLLHKSDEHAYFRSRIGIGNAQIYARSSYRYKESFFDDSFVVSVEPSIDYFMEDGLGYRFLAQASYFPSENSELRAFYSLWDREKFYTPKWKKAIYHLTKLNAKSTLITGVLVNGVKQPDYRDEKVTVSTRLRRHALRRWLFFEVEPFLDFKRQEDYKARWGVALRVGGYFGYQ